MAAESDGVLGARRGRLSDLKLFAMRILLRQLNELVEDVIDEEFVELNKRVPRHSASSLFPILSLVLAAVVLSYCTWKAYTYGSKEGLVPGAISNAMAGRFALQAGKYQEALTYFSAAGITEEALAGKMECLFRLEQYDDCLSVSHQLTALNARNGFAQLFRGHALIAKGKIDEGKVALRLAGDLDEPLGYVELRRLVRRK